MIHAGNLRLRRLKQKKPEVWGYPELQSRTLSWKTEQKKGGGKEKRALTSGCHRWEVQGWSDRLGPVGVMNTFWDEDAPHIQYSTCQACARPWVWLPAVPPKRQTGLVPSDGNASIFLKKSLTCGLFKKTNVMNCFNKECLEDLMLMFAVHCCQLLC